jgi:predicted RNA-binding protein with RPS1 domain
VADLKVGDVVEGTVTKIVNFGAFVRVRDGLEGLIHISELSHQRVAHPGDVVHEGQALQLKVISLDSERHRLGLSLKQAEEAPRRPAPTRERRPRERGYDVSQAIQEPEGGIDNTLAAAFAQVRAQMAEQDAARAPRPEREPVETEEVVVAEPMAAAVETEEVVVAEPEPAVEEPVPAVEEPVPAAVEPEPEPEPAAEEPEPEPAVAEPEPEPQEADSAAEAVEAPTGDETPEPDQES